MKPDIISDNVGSQHSAAVVDDHPFFREIARKCLDLLGFKVVIEAPHGNALLSSLDKCSTLPEICLLDIEMPVLNGFETSRLLRQRYPMIKVVALTLQVDDIKRRRMMEAGAYAVLEKNIEPEQLKQALFDALSA